MRVTRVLHVSRNVESRLAETASWYAEVLGLGAVDRPEIPGIDGRWFGVGPAQVHLVDAPAGDGPIRPTGDHWCLGVDDIHGAIDELRSRGVDFVEAAQGKTIQVWIRDPAGGTIELQQDPGAS